jgi:hypothetical protein
MDEQTARDMLLEAVEGLAELGWDEERIRSEFENAVVVAQDEGVLP